MNGDIFAKRREKGKVVKDAHGNELFVNTYYNERYAKKPWYFRGGGKELHFATYEELRQFVANRGRDAANHIDVKAGATLTYNDLFPMVVERKTRKPKNGRSKWSEDTRWEYEYRWNLYIRNHKIANTPIFAVYQSDVQDFADELRVKLAASYARKIVDLISAAADLAVSMGKLVGNPAKKIDYHTAAPRRVDLTDLGADLPEDELLALSREQEEHFFDWLKGSNVYKYYYPIFRFQSVTGLRVSEVCGVLWRNLSDTHICIDHQLKLKRSDEKIKEIRHTKTTAGDRLILATPEIRELLEEARLHGRCRETIGGYNDFIFVTKKYKKTFDLKSYNSFLHRAEDAYNRYEEKAAASQGRAPVTMPRVSSHALRRTCATRWAQEGVSDLAIIQQLGHESINTTYQHYIKQQQDFTDREMAKTTPYHGFKLVQKKPKTGTEN